MRIFSTLKHLNKWHYINAKNVQKYLVTFPYLQKSQYFAVCYYCHNPIKIVQRFSAKEDKLSFYGIHLKKPINGFDHFNKDKLNHCLLNKKAQLMVFNPLSKPQFDLAEVDHNVLRKDLCYYTGIYFSLKLTEQFLNENPDIPYYRNADSFNLPFIVLLNAKRLNLKYRKIANPRLIKAIEGKSKNFQVSSSQILPKSPDSSAKLYMYFKDQKIESSNLLSLKVSVVESCNGSKILIYSFHIFAKMFNNLIRREDEKGGD